MDQPVSAKAPQQPLPGVVVERRTHPISGLVEGPAGTRLRNPMRWRGGGKQPEQRPAVRTTGATEPRLPRDRYRRRRSP